MTRYLIGTLALAALVLAGGCQEPNIHVDRSDATELEAVSTLLAKRVDYAHRLSVLEAYYRNTGNLDKLRWTRREIRNLQKTTAAVDIRTDPPIEILPPEGEAVLDRDERVLIERAVAARREYLAALEDLGQYYTDSGQAEKAQAVDKMQTTFNHARTYMYDLASLPAADLTPAVVYAEADELYAEAKRLYEEGKVLLKLTPDLEKEEQALVKFKQLIADYPNSTKIALSAYFIAEIYKEFFDENILAVHWYKRAWQWDPEIDQPARFQAATVYDMRLDNVPKAVELYRAAIKHDPYRLGNDNFARGRIIELTQPPERRSR
jgi:tetratricopeptide (TPR) repeat protein